jgi:hypothetical protein
VLDASRNHAKEAGTGSDRQRALQLYLRGDITVDELVDVMDRQGNWVEQLIRDLSANPTPIARIASWMRRAL